MYNIQLLPDGSIRSQQGFAINTFFVCADEAGGYTWYPHLVLFLNTTVSSSLC